MSRFELETLINISNFHNYTKKILLSEYSSLANAEFQAEKKHKDKITKAKNKIQEKIFKNFYEYTNKYANAQGLSKTIGMELPKNVRTANKEDMQSIMSQFAKKFK